MITHSRLGRCLVALLFAGLFLFCGETTAQTAPATESSASASPKQNLTRLVIDTGRFRTLSIAQAPDETKTVTLADLLAEENKRLKKRIADLEKENTELKQRLAHP